MQHKQAQQEEEQRRRNTPLRMKNSNFRNLAKKTQQLISKTKKVGKNKQYYNPEQQHEQKNRQEYGPSDEEEGETPPQKRRLVEDIQPKTTRNSENTKTLLE